MSSSRYSFVAVLICLLGASFYMYEFVLQVSLGVMTNELMRDMSLNAASLGIVSAFFYYAYMPMQIPAGLLYDRFGIRNILTFAILICALGALAFSYSYTIWLASSGRFLMGIGSAFSFSGALMLIARWFPPRSFAILSGIVQLMSSIGAITGELPLALAIDHWQWRPTMFYLGIFGIGLAVLVWLIVRNAPKNSTQHQSITQRHTTQSKPPLKQVFGRTEPWLIAFYSFLVWAPIAAFAGLWGVPFLASAYHITTESASLACAAIWIGIGIGCPLIGWISERIERRCIVLSVCGALGVIGSVMTIYFILPLPLLYLSLFLLGCAGSGQSLAFSVVRDTNHPDVMGAAIGLNNMATVAGGAILQPIIGFLLYANWDGVMMNNIPIYNAFNYRIALLMIPICYFIAFIVSMKYIKETHCKQKFPLY